MRLWLVVALGAMALAGCSQPSAPTAAPAVRPAHATRPPVRKAPFRIVGVSASRTRMDPAKREKLDVHFSIDAPASVKLQIFDGRDALIYEGKPVDFASGEHVLSWDGTDASDDRVPDEAYSYVLVAENATGQVIYDVTDSTGNEALVVNNPVLDAKSGLLSFRLDHPARINVRFGLADGPYMRTVVDWVARDAGDQTVAWDGMDASKVLNLSQHPMIRPTVRAFTLPTNTVFVGSDASAVRFSSMEPLGTRKKEKPEFKTRMFFHGDQPLDTRGDIPVELRLPGNTRRDAEGRWIVSGKVPVHLDVPAAVRARVMQRRFEPAFYTDGIFVFEQEVGVLPINWIFDSSVVNPGEHFLTANIRGYEGNYGAATLRVWVEPARTLPPQGKAP